jgi:O-ureido-D-serine cyclo-ligase
MLQPYLERVDEQGETAVIYIGGEYSHAIRKGPLLRLGDDLVTGLFAPEHITPREPDVAERRVAAAAFASIADANPLYARIDLVCNERGDPVVLELELTEPSLFFLHAPDAAGRFADALLES